MNETQKIKSGWRWLRRVLITLAVLATLIAAFYTEEDWRGKRAWENCQRELEAKGMLLDWNASIPPAVPDEQNFFKVPKMQEWFVGRNITNDLYLRMNDKKFENITHSAGTTGNLIITAAEAKEYLTWSDQFEPDFDLIREALKRVYARMDGNYTVPAEIPIPNFVASRALAQVLAQRTKCYLLLGQPDQALHEITLLNDSRTWLEGAPTGKPMTLMAAMINVAISGLYVESIADGLEKNSWQEPQLAALQQQLAAINLVPIVASAFAFEPMAVCRDLEIMKPSEVFYVSGSNHGVKLRDRLLDLIPRGWIYQNMTVIARMEFKNHSAFDLAHNLFLPSVAQSVYGETAQIVSQAQFSPYSFLTTVTFPNFVVATQTFSKKQTLVNECQIACALERYRLAHGEYPETLDALVPQFIEKLPHDIIGGEHLRYRRTGAGKFLLYSVGWNETDDGGQVVLTKDGSVDREKGDWVWQYPVK
jgi:hypothetical protein